MARSRVGGTKSKKSGALGSEVYQVRRDADGSYYQYVYAKPEDKKLGLSPTLARQRMIMSIIMRHMGLLRPFMNACSQYVPEGSLSVQEFVRLNIKRLSQLADDERYDWAQVWWPLYGENFALPASLQITDGDFNNFSLGLDEIVSEDNLSWAILNFGDYGESWTWRDWCERYSVYPNNFGVVLFFCMQSDSDPEAYHYVRFHLLPNVPLDERIEVQGFQKFVVIDSDMPVWQWSYSIDEFGWRMWTIESRHDTLLNYCMGVGDLIFGWVDGKRHLSKSMIYTGIYAQRPEAVKHSFEEAYQTWYDDRLANNG